ncbi:CaiB/BaiF CoA transferase family protein [Natrarchaeobius oligotrophus]|uniref:CoA transferase n=1 Tax=Natrarchaeobius chitinivorans TaxID=1679083 RepID=A0A3N6MEQ2_NATCH|nr:CoA transferase [Natrarchaeobius chitinivorans]RQH02474.1 CoA transferase [Natrarchaeobius chitinivorans]
MTGDADRGGGESVREADDSPKPLEGIRVLDFTWVYAGPHATKHLAALGADVVKVESKYKPDMMRYGYTYDEFEAGESPNVSAFYNEFNLGKRSLRLNLKRERGRELALELAAAADVWIENFSPGFLRSIDLGYESVRAVNPEIVSVSMPGWASSGPAAEYRAWGMNLEAMAGLDHLSGRPDDPPTPAGFSWPDPTAGVMAVFAILAALASRESTGEGRRIEIPQFETTVSLLHGALATADLTGESGERTGARDEDRRFVQGVYECRGEDDWLAVAVGTDAQWRTLCDVVGRPELATDSELATHAARLRNHDRFDEVVESWSRDTNAEEARTTLQERGVPAGRVANERDLVEDDPQLRERTTFVERDHPEVGERTYTGFPSEFSAVDVTPPSRAPLFGEHTDDVLRDWLEMPDERIDRLQTDEILY